MPLQQILPTWVALNGANSASPSGFSDMRTGDPIYGGGLNLGDYFDVTEAEAKNHSWSQNGILHWGRYRWVKLDPAANPAMIGIGKLGYMPTALEPDVNTVTSQDHGITAPAGANDGRVRMVVFLNVITPGNYGFVQELGVGTVSVAAAPAAALGFALYFGTNGDAVPGTATGITGAGFGIVLAAVPATGGLILSLLDFPVIQG